MVNPFSQVLRHFLQTHMGSFGVVSIEDIKMLRPGDIVSVWKVAYPSEPYALNGMNFRYKEMDSGEMPWLIL